MSTYAVRRPLMRWTTPRPAAEIVGALVVAGAVAGLTWLFDSSGMLGVGAALVGAVSLWLATTRKTQLALAVLMVYLGTLDGYLKLASGSDVVTFLRDILLFAIVVGLLVRAQVDGTRLKAPPLTVWVGGFVVVVLVQILNPQGGTLVHSLAGVRQHLEFVPLFFLTFAFVRTTRALRGFVVLLALIATANGVASWMQFKLTPEQMASWGPGYSERVLAKGNFSNAGRSFAGKGGQKQTRPFGLGSDAGAGGFMGALALGAVLALASLFTRLRYLLFAVAMAIGATVAVVTSQGRGVVVCAFIVVLAYGLLTVTSRGRLVSLLGIAMAGVVAFFVVQSVVGSVGSSALRYEGLSGSKIVQTTDEARGKSIAAIPRTAAKYPLGAGLGTAGPASVAPGGNELVNRVDAESELSFLTLETGIVGAILLTAFPITLFTLGLRRCRHEPDREARVLLAAVIAPVAGILALYLPGGGLTATVPGGPYLWAVAGIVSYWLVARPAERRRNRPAALAP